MVVRYKNRPPVLLNTNILIPILRGRRHPKVSTELAESIQREISIIGERHILICPVVVGELYVEMTDSERKATKQTLRAYPSYPLNKEISQMFEHLMYSYRRFSPAVADTLIGATTAVANAQLWTTNRRHFAYFDEVQLYYPSLRHKFN